jgi:hypoxanthine phosphoribosyltransferase
MKKNNITWKNFGNLISYLEREIKKDPRFKQIKNVYGIPRGGLVIALCLSHKFEIPLILDPKNITEHTLVVDDISDTGETFKKIVGNTKVLTAALFQSPDTKFKVNFFAEYKFDNWIQYPWELKTSKLEKNNTIK